MLDNRPGNPNAGITFPSRENRPETCFRGLFQNELILQGVSASPQHVLLINSAYKLPLIMEEVFSDLVIQG